MCWKKILENFLEVFTMCKNWKKKMNKINFYKFIWFIRKLNKIFKVEY